MAAGRARRMAFYAVVMASFCLFLVRNNRSRVRDFRGEVLRSRAPVSPKKMSVPSLKKNGVPRRSGPRRKKITPIVAMIASTPQKACSRPSGNDMWSDQQLDLEDKRQPSNLAGSNASQMKLEEEAKDTDWFTALPKKFVIPQEDLSNVYNLPRNFTAKYKIDTKNILGEGAYGTVFMAKDRDTGIKMAVKVLYKRVHKKKQRPADARYLCRMKNELEMMKIMGKGPYAVEFHEAYEDHDNLYLVMELCDGPNLKQYLKQNPVNEDRARVIMAQIMRMLACWHEKGYMHCDMKPANLLLGGPNLEYLHVKATDFGLAHEVCKDSWHHKRQGTKVYMAPEMLQKRYDERADIWSVGVIAYQMLAGRLPFCSDDQHLRRLKPEQLEERILFRDLDFSSTPTWDNISPEGADFVSKLLYRNPQDRLSAREALEHPWIATVGENAVERLHNMENQQRKRSREKIPV
mmetsp:Transcript_18097/g.27145  ORF Transcript_18097/g.27145 Transcript_18097/m.27145 type:complete len:462 (-) Transcript_18097:84-1469(-)